MLKITISETPTEMRLTVQGRIVGPWVGELRSSWGKTRRACNGRVCIVDLNDVSFIDKGGERLLRAMYSRGVQFRATGVYTRHVLEQLPCGRKRGSFKPFAWLFVAILLVRIAGVSSTWPASPLARTDPGNHVGARGSSSGASQVATVTGPHFKV